MSTAKAEAAEKTGEAVARDQPLAPPEPHGWRPFCDGLAQYAVATVVAVVVLAVFFPGNRFLPVPWQHDDFKFLAAPAHLQNGCGLELPCTRPVSTNILWRMGMLGETPFYIGMFLLATMIPVLAVRLALKLFRSAPGPWVVLGLTGGVSACTFLFEHSLWIYRYTGLVTNLTSVVLGMLAAYSFSRWLDGRRAGFWAGAFLFLANALAKEDMLLFVPLFVGAEWVVRRRQGADQAPLSRLAWAYAAIAVGGGSLFAWNTWIFPSPFIDKCDAYRVSFSLPHLARQVWAYAAATHLTKVALLALLAAAVLGACRPQRRLAALAMVPLVVAMILPYAVLPRFFEYYCMNWLSMAVALAAVCIAASCRGWFSPRWAGIAWLAPVAVLAAIFAFSPSSANFRYCFATWLNSKQAESQYVLEQIEHHQDELAGADTVAVRGADDIFSPWLLTTGNYVNMKLGRRIHWLLVARPQTLAGQYLNSGSLPSGDVTMVREEDRASYAGVAVLNFDKNLNMTVQTTPKETAAARAATVVK
jgi:hypothetical protein